ncbi:MAG TPA: PQQ-dependent sugar dehydrogenase [Candidatus Krumholzibacteria bacterium]|nr:PQQ-dependent sugar dehydrogenase [Candidatus Krumholzibacteria bacterium]
MKRGLLTMGLAVAAAAAAAPARAQPAYRLAEAFPALEFKRPVGVESAHDGSGRLFVVEQDGLVRVFRNDPGAKQSEVFLDLRERVSTDGNEMGLLGMAFAPDFARSGVFYVDYTASKRLKRVTRLSRLTVGPYKNAASVASEMTVIEIEQPWANHNGGQIAFGPDGMLYVAMGDGGSGGDPQGNAQNRKSLLGKILRLDIARHPYTIPADNPFRGNAQGWREEIYAYGLRNPWRFSFDRATGELWAGDVGQVTWEEINVVAAGKNYGWDCREGMHPYEPAEQRAPACASAGEMADPVWAYGRDQGISVTGGFVYRGSALPDLVGWYVYGDYGSGRIWALRRVDGRTENRLLLRANILISSFGCDEDGELIVCAHDPTGRPTQLYRLVTE